MPSLEEARRLILDSITPLASERVELLESLGRVTAEDIVAPWNLPSCEPRRPAPSMRVARSKL